ncbi:MAG: sulfurtransferase TusA family protein [Deltaproteobacteria bacterium]|nr:sulfurtransferase TusA family protein [Deltaproteobacteria bacterium]
MSKTIDARGLSCPQPVLMTLDEIKTGGENELLVMVDSEASKENVSRASENKGWEVASITQVASEYHIAIKKG